MVTMVTMMRKVRKRKKGDSSEGEKIAGEY